jgi:glycosyltransferase involved in cell wall biosynthesis
MNRVCLITKYKNYPGGVETFNKYLIQLLTENNFDVTLLSSEGYKIKTREIIPFKIIQDPFITSKLFEKTKKEYDLVICNGEFGYKIKHERCICVFHGSYYGYAKAMQDKLSTKNHLRNYISHKIQEKAAKNKTVIAVSDTVKKIFNKFSINVHQVIENCVNLDIFFPMDIQRKGLLFVGRYDYWGKGFDILEEISDNGYRIDCLSNNYPGKKLIKISETPYEKMSFLYNRYKILIFPSRFEGMPFVPLEAMACGVPVIINNIEPSFKLSKIIPEFVVQENHANNYIQRIKLIEENYHYFSKKAREYVEKHHDIKYFNEKWIRLLNNI